MKKILIAMLLIQSISFCQNVYLKDGSVLRSALVMDTLDNRVNIFSQNGYLRISLNEILRVGPSQICIVTLYDGKSIKGDFISSTDSSVSYETDYGRLVVDKKNIYSIKNISDRNPAAIPDADRYRQINRSVTTEYRDLPWLIVTVGAAVGAGLWFNDAKNYSNASDVFNKLNLNVAANEARNKSDEKILYGIGASVIAIVSFIVAVEPTETYSDQQITMIPTQNGLRMVVHF